MDGFIDQTRFSNCFVLPTSGYFCEQNENESNIEDNFDNVVLYYQYIIVTPNSKVKRDLVSLFLVILIYLLMQTGKKKFHFARGNQKRLSFVFLIVFHQVRDTTPKWCLRGVRSLFIAYFSFIFPNSWR